MFRTTTTDIPDGHVVIVSPRDKDPPAVVDRRGRCENQTLVSFPSASAPVLVVEFLNRVSPLNPSLESRRNAAYSGSTTRTGAVDETSADRECEHILDVGLDTTHELSGVEVPHIDISF